MKKFAALSLIFILAGCSSLYNAKNPETPVEQLCRDLNRNIIFNNASTPNMEPASATQRAEMYRLYDKYNCGKLKK
jgi:hypothetical protein